MRIVRSSLEKARVKYYYQEEKGRIEGKINNFCIFLQVEEFIFAILVVLLEFYVMRSYY